MAKGGAPKENENAATHGVYSVQRSGEIPAARRTPAIVTRLEEIQTNLADAEGLEREQEQVTETALVSLELALSWVQKKREEGQSLDNIKVFKMLPALVNSAGRQLAQLMDMKERLGKASALIADYEAILQEAGDE